MEDEDSNLLSITMAPSNSNALPVKELASTQSEPHWLEIDAYILTFYIYLYRYIIYVIDFGILLYCGECKI